MENKHIQTNYQTSNKWKASAIMLIVVSVILAGTTTLFAAHNIPKTAETPQEDNENNTDQAYEEENSDNKNTSDNNSNVRYLIVAEWGLKFQIPDEISELSYQIVNYDETDSLVFNGVFNIIPNQGKQTDFSEHSFGSISRELQANDPNVDCEVSCGMFMGSHDGFNYYFLANGQHISNDGNVQYQQEILIYLMNRMVYKAQFI